MAKKPQSPQPNPAAPEIYADRAASVALRGNVARITLASDRTVSDSDEPVQTVSGHVAMSVRGFLHLFAQMQSVVRQMEDTGLLKRPDAGAPDSPKTPAKEPEEPKKTAKKPARKRAARSKKT